MSPHEASSPGRHCPWERIILPQEDIPLGMFSFGEMLISRKANFFLGEEIPNSKRHEQDKEETYRTLKTLGANQGFFEPSSFVSTFFWLRFDP